jgi:hypothetical protein
MGAMSELDIKTEELAERIAYEIAQLPPMSPKQRYDRAKTVIHERVLEFVDREFISGPLDRDYQEDLDRKMTAERGLI